MSKTKYLYLGADLKIAAIHASIMHNNSLRDLTLITLSVVRFEGTGGFLIRYAVTRSKHIAN